MINRATYYNWNRDESEFLYIDDVENAVDSLVTILFMLKRNDKLKWKWIVLCLQHSLYHFCIANLKGTNWRQVIVSENGNDNNIFFKRDQENWKKSEIKDKRKSGAYRINWIELTGEPPIIINKKKKDGSIINEYLIPFWTAFARVQDGEFWMDKTTLDKALFVDEDSLLKVEDLMYFRNKFVHFVPISSSINVNNIKKIVSPILDMISFLALETDLKYLYDENFDKRIIKIVTNIKRKII